MRSQYSHSSRENETPSSSTSLLASCKGLPPPPPHPRDSAIHWINYYPNDSALGFCNLLSLWIAIYSMDSAIQLLNNRGWWIKVKNGSARNLLVNCWPEEFTNSFTNSSVQDSASHVLFLHSHHSLCSFNSLFPGSKWPKMIAIQG